MSTLAQDFNVGAVQGGHYQRMDVTLTWDSDVPMEFRLHVLQPGADGEDVTVIWSVSRDLLAEVMDTAERTGIRGIGDVVATWVRGNGIFAINSVFLRLASDTSSPVSLSFRFDPLAAFVRSSLAMCPIESEAVDVDGLITQIFHAEEAQ